MRPSIKLLLATLVVLCGVTAGLARWQVSGRPSTADARIEEAFRQAAALGAEGSWALALERLEAIDQARLDADQRRWLTLYRADALWRSVTSDRIEDPSALEAAREQLLELIEGGEIEADHDLVWAEANESLADSYWIPRHQRNYGMAFRYYSQALEWWAASRDIETARENYLEIVWKLAEEGESPYSGRPDIPAEILENALRIAQTREDRARASYLLALTLSAEGDPRQQERIDSLFSRAAEPGRGEDFHDDVLYHWAQWLERMGGVVQAADGTWRREGDLERALEVYRRLLAEYRRGTSPWVDQARERVQTITQPSLSVEVSNVFLPESNVTFRLSSRNVSTVSLNLWKVDLTRDLRMQSNKSWLKGIDTTGAQRVEQWVHQVETKRPHAPSWQRLPMPRKLPLGAYLLVATAGGVSARELVLVTDISLVVKSGVDGSLVLVADAQSGEPVNGATLVSRVEQRGIGERVQEARGRTGADGTGRLETVQSEHWRSSLIIAAAGDRQAIARSVTWGRNVPATSWRVFAETDRPAYRPDEVVNWKITARTRVHEVYDTPANQEIFYRIADPRGAEVAKGSLRLNEFGSAWGELDLAHDATLGLYHITFATDAALQRPIGSETLFRVEEYKLPEFRVTVTPLEQPGDELAGPGDEVRAAIDVEYYFGGPVRNASVEVVIRQRPYHIYWNRREEHAWIRSSRIMPPQWPAGQEISRQTLTTGESGKAVVTFEVPQGRGTAEYEIEARVVDSSRREVIGTGSVRTSDAPFFAHLQPEHYLYRPGARATIELETKDVNERPVSADGRLEITREQWREVWLDPSGRKVEGARLDEIRRSMVFPPRHEPDEHGWKLIHRGYEVEKIATVDLDTGADGKGSYTFTPEREGFYRFAWNGHLRTVARPVPADTVSAGTTIWVAANSAAKLGYHAGGLEIITDPGEFRTGATARVLIAAPEAGHHVLFTVETDQVLEHRVVHMKESAYVFELSLDARHVPNVFLTAASVRDLQLHMDVEEVVVPPVEQILDVELSAGAEEYRPGETGELTVTTRDHAGRPVSAELSLSVADESVFYIQAELSADPRAFFLGLQRAHRVRTSSSFEFRRYVDPEEADDLEESEEGAVVGGVVGGVIGGVDMRRGEGVAEQITVTASAVAPAAPPPAVAEMKQQMVADGAGVEGSVRVRSDFRTTAFWQPDVRTAADGTARVRVRFPDSLTTWRATARAVTRGSGFGVAATSVVTDQPLTVRLQAPRFFVAGDESRVSALISNHTGSDISVAPTITVSGLQLGREATLPAVSIPAGDERLVEWPVAAGSPGTAVIRITAQGSALSDSVEWAIPVHEHGIEKLIAASGKIDADSATVNLEIPAERRSGSTRMELALTPSIAVTMVDALPYLIEFPYGCTEQTMSRFLPAVIVSRTLENLGVSRGIVANRILGGVEAEVAGNRPDRASQLRRLDAVTEAGLARLYDMQKPDGSWGWWKEGDSDPWMTAYVVWGFALAEDAGLSVRRESLQRAVSWVDEALVGAERQPDLHAWMLHALTAAGSPRSANVQRAFATLYEERAELTSYGRALLALSAHRMGRASEAAVLVRNLENAAQRDESPDTSVISTTPRAGRETAMETVHWGSSRSDWWRWVDTPVESTSFVLRALVTIDPGHRLIEPAMNWLVRNRRGAQWNNTRDTAIAVLALDEYLRASGEAVAEGSWVITINGQDFGTRTFSPADVFTVPATITIPSASIRDGTNTIQIRRRGGSSPIYFAVEARFFSEEEPVREAANELFVRREYYRIVPQPTLLTGYVEERVPLKDGETITTGDRVEVVVTVETKNDYEYLMFEDLKPAGLEAVSVQSGQPLMARRLSSDAVEQRFVEKTQPGSGPRGEDLRRRRPDHQGVIDTRWIHQELRDRAVALFADELPQGVWEIRYVLRAEVPGRYHALPLVGQAMYVPEIRGNSEEIRVAVADRE